MKYRWVRDIYDMEWSLKIDRLASSFQLGDEQPSGGQVEGRADSDQDLGSANRSSWLGVIIPFSIASILGDTMSPYGASYRVDIP